MDAGNQKSAILSNTFRFQPCLSVKFSLNLNKVVQREAPGQNYGKSFSFWRFCQISKTGGREFLNF